MEFLRDSIWQFIGASISLFVGIIAIFQGWYIYTSSKSNKSLVCTLMNGYEHKITPVKSEIEVKTFFKGKEIKNASILSFNFYNSGNRPIEVKDFLEPLKLYFNTEATILHSEIIQKFPENLKVSIKNQEKSNLVFEEILLNQSEFFTVKVIVEEFSHFEALARISGISTIRHVNLYAYQAQEEPNLKPTLARFLIISVILGIGIGFLYQSFWRI